jgi:hypothetical protein
MAQRTQSQRFQSTAYSKGSQMSQLSTPSNSSAPQNVGYIDPSLDSHFNQLQQRLRQFRDDDDDDQDDDED